MTLTLFSPAKINLFLRVLGKRSDGYHELASLLQAIDLGDTLTFSFSKEDRLTCNDTNLPCDASNLIAKAVALFRRKTGFHFSISIHLEKKIPMQAGLGGGSSNAATTLWALNALHNHKIPLHELQAWSAEIGSDVPFFFSHGTAYCTGRGENVRDLKELPLQHSLALFKPDEGISTPAVYKALKLQKCSKKDPEEMLAGFYSANPCFHNDLEDPAFRLLPHLQIFKEILVKNGAAHVMMTGSGSAFFGFNDRGMPAKPLRREVAHWYKQ